MASQTPRSPRESQRGDDERQKRDSQRSAGDTESESTALVSLDGDRQVAYATYGDPDCKPVVFLHGTPGSRRLGAVFDTAARERSIRVLAPDRPGYGRSTHWDEYSMRDTGAVVEAVLDDVGVAPAGLVAFSGGAPYALATTATRPELVTSVDIVAGATPPACSDATPATQRLLGALAANTPRILRGLFRGQAWLADRASPSFVVSQYTTDTPAEAVSDHVAAVVKDDFVEAIAGGGRGVVSEFRETTSAWDLSLDDIDREVRVWHGERDTNVPVDGARRLNAKIPNARMHVFDDADHLQTLVRSIPAVLDAHERGD
ncbi:alpha/beta fold family hydrolase [Haloferax mucosum ATCC BAA-1512]|uniref:Alpha/beta fold family hydrolase n=1 Tax=Haloferax mucosum ATCC BAA-1512 TaxID=662479 RepID=M0IF74_9EURY|nr:alpha/beta hydrolase [Haloferax mucosum]ELZ94094.1 alpha/beta fold family hydrolase [Haloferax mucosum ATCC BAA-1512]